MRAVLQCAFFLPALVIGTCTTEVGIDYPGHDLKPLTPRHVPAYSDCCAACLNVTECSHWTFQANPGSPTICWLKDAGAGKSRKPTKNHVSGWAGTGPAPSPAPPTPVAPCSTDLSCQLNGICTAGKCVCDPAWKGDACEQLSLVPAKSLDPAYPPAAWKLNTTSWGGSVVKAEDGKYHMFAAEMLNSCGMSTWTTNSAIRHAVASAPEGPYQPKEIVMNPFAHNPTALRAPDGTYLIYHIGCGTPVAGHAPCTDCHNGVSGHCDHPSEKKDIACTTNTTNILYSNSLDGPWQQLNAPIIDSATMGKPFQVDNPTVTFFANGSLLMLGRGGNPKKESASDGVITAPSWRGPYTMHAEISTDPKQPDVEDPFVWQDHRGNFHALFHKFTDEHPSCGGHAYSEDGFTWTLPDTTTYTTDITLTNGTKVTFNRRERPHLLFDSTGTRPTVLFTSLTNWGGKSGDSAFTFAQVVAAPLAPAPALPSLADRAGSAAI